MMGIEGLKWRNEVLYPRLTLFKIHLLLIQSSDGTNDTPQGSV